MNYREILYEVKDGVALVTLNRPDKLNAWTTRMAEEIQDATLAAAEDDAARVIVLTGAGRGFCAGADMKLLSDMGGGGKGQAATEDPDDVPRPRPSAVRRDFTHKYSYFPAIPKPVIAAINGPVAGIGLVMTLYCDIRIAATDAKFTSAFVKRGLIAEYGGAWLAERVMGVANALEVFLSGRIFDGDEARRLGLVNLTFPSEGFLEAALTYARDLAANNSPRSMRVIKQQIWESLFQDLDAGVELSLVEMKASIASDDFKEGVAHFLEKRAPRFSGR
ncbi:MAG: enoyl-CoA hydratase/isomerase family protein [Pseudomonadales bacterium]|nr:enoyl-CoA hydratase/isomerase family protein [Pseudomonadales bacterium]